MTDQNKQDQIAKYVIYTVSALVLAFLFWLIYFQTGSNDAQASKFSFLKEVNASLNTLTAFLLCLGYYFIKKVKNKSAHIKCMLLATTTSAMFLVSYIIYHYFHGDTKFLGEGLIRLVYFFILISHIGLSMIMVPMIFLTLYFAFTSNYSKHKKLAKVTFPIWLYVSVTGVMIYFFLNF